MTLSIKVLYVTLSITMLCYYAERHYAECPISFTNMMNVVMLNVVMLNVVMLNVIMLHIVAPTPSLTLKHQTKIEMFTIGILNVF